MHLQFTEEQLMIQKLVRDFAKNEIAPFVEEMEKGAFPTHLLKKLGELGLMGITAPSSLGGADMDFTSYIIAINELSKVSATMGVILSVHTSVGTNPIIYYGNREQRNKYVPKLASGEWIGAFCLTEPGAGSDAASIKTRAERKDNHYVINGSKVFITNGGEAQVYIVFAVTDPQAGARGISAFIVNKHTPGFLVGKDEGKMGLHGSRTVQLTFDNMVVPKENLLGNEGDGFKIAMSNLDVGRIGIAAQSLGIAEAALEAAVQYAQERVQFGNRLRSNKG